MLVSVVIPTYNRAKTICRTVDSVLAQTWKDVEVIIVDDGSTDQTGQVLRIYENKARIIRQKNGGPSAARNTGIRAATGEVISFLDSDDTWLPTKLERQLKLLERTQSDGVVCCVCNARMKFLSGSKTSFDSAQLYPDLSEGIWANPADILMSRFLLFNQVAAVRREALLQAGLFREDLPYGLNDDYDLALRLSLMGLWSFIAEPLTEWHEHTDNISRTHRQLEINICTLRILEDIGASPQFRSLLPQRRFNRRLRALRSGIIALRLRAHQNPVLQRLGYLLSCYFRGCEALRSKILPDPHMITRKA